MSATGTAEGQTIQQGAKGAGLTHRHILAPLKLEAANECGSVMEAVISHVRPGDVVTLFTVIPPDSGRASATVYHGEEKLNAQRDKLSVLAEERLSYLFRLSKFVTDDEEKDGIQVISRVMVGDVVQEVLRFARELNSDLIILSKKRKETVTSSSITNKIINAAPCPVMIAHDGNWPLGA